MIQFSWLELRPLSQVKAAQACWQCTLLVHAFKPSRQYPQDMRGDERDLSSCVNEGQLFGIYVLMYHAWIFDISTAESFKSSTTNLAMYNNEQTVLIAWYRSKIMNRTPMLSIKSPTTKTSVLTVQLLWTRSGKPQLCESSGKDGRNSGVYTLFSTSDSLLVFSFKSTWNQASWYQLLNTPTKHELFPGRMFWWDRRFG